ncbi:reverse transcriptase domain-containing protein [Tanacetum coccineum]
MLQRCEDTDLCLNWEKSHFMVKEGIVLGHKISKKGIEVDNAKINVIAMLPHPQPLWCCLEFFFVWDLPFEHMCIARTLPIGLQSLGKNLPRLEQKDSDIRINSALKISLSKTIPRRDCTVGSPPSMRTVGENRALWSDKLDDALWAFRTAFKTSIGCIPYKLAYGKSCHLPIELEYKAYWALKHANFDLKTSGDHRKLQLNELNEFRDPFYENSLLYKERTKKLHDSKIKNRIFNVGDQVLLFNSRLKIFSGKLKTR